ncbi:hypothetical protein LV779_14090 [Streptomyces thinghirensis]|nr:hypothetical protein [Streptomyces thinghirensis]
MTSRPSSTPSTSRDLLDLDAVRPDSAYLKVMSGYADSTYRSNRDASTGLFRFQPSGGGDFDPEAPAATLNQSAMVQIFATLADATHEHRRPSLTRHPTPPHATAPSTQRTLTHHAQATVDPAVLVGLRHRARHPQGSVWPPLPTWAACGCSCRESLYCAATARVACCSPSACGYAVPTAPPTRASPGPVSPPARAPRPLRVPGRTGRRHPPPGPGDGSSHRLADRASRTGRGTRLAFEARPQRHWTLHLVQHPTSTSAAPTREGGSWPRAAPHLDSLLELCRDTRRVAGARPVPLGRRRLPLLPGLAGQPAPATGGALPRPGP